MFGQKNMLNINNMTTYEKLHEKICEIIPEIKELKFGCKIRCLDYPGIEDTRLFVGKEWNREYGRYENKVLKEQIYNIDKKFEIIGRDIFLDDVLMSISKKGLPDGYLFFNANWRGNLELSGIDGRIFIKYEYGKPLHEQSEQTQLAILNLLKQYG